MVNEIKKIKILSIEDDEFMRIFLRDVFWIHGGEKEFDFSMAETIEEARKFISKTIPDIIFLDMALPEKEGETPSAKNGLGFLQEIKSNPSMKKVKVLVFSGYTDKDVKKKAMEMGADMFLVKGDLLPKELFEAASKFAKNL